jgi:hypothetical protein
LVTAVLTLVGARTAYAGPWLPGAWHFVVYLRESVQLANDRYDVGGALKPVMAVDGQGATVRSFFGDATTALGTEVGVASRLSLTADFWALRGTWERLGDAGSRSSVGVSDLSLGAKLLIFDDEITAALQVAVTFPIGDSTAAVPLGLGDTRTDMVLLVGRMFERVPLFLFGELGACIRSAAKVTDPLMPGTTKTVDYASQVVYGATLGYTAQGKRRGFRSVAVMVRVEGRYSLRTATDEGVGTFTPVTPTMLKLGPQLSFAPTKTFELFAGGSYFVLGRAVPAWADAVLGLQVRH